MNKRLLSKTVYLSTILLLSLYLLLLYRMEASILSELNDNVFQFVMISHSHKILDEILNGNLSIWYLFDNWNPLWNQGFPLTFYYNFLPQIFVDLGYRFLSLFSSSVTLFRFFEFTKYLFISLTPLSFFVGVRWLGFSRRASALASFFVAFIFTNGLYGFDITSYLWIGFGLTSQLWATFFIPLAFGATARFLREPSRKNFLVSLIFNFAILQTHIGMGIITIFSEMFLLIKNYQKINIEKLTRKSTLLLLLFLGTGVSVANFIVPIIAYDRFRNISHWEGLWKFNSFGWQTVLTDFANGNLFDFGRFPLITVLAIVGLFLSLVKRPKYSYIAFGFIFWLLAFFGRSTWGNIYNYIPGLSDFYLHRLIIGVQFFGILLATVATDHLITYLAKRTRVSKLILSLGSLVILFLLLSPKVRSYAKDSSFWVDKANKEYASDSVDFKKVLNLLEEKNKDRKRIYAGGAGNWGKNFTVGQTQVYQNLSLSGWPVIYYFPHAWSQSSEAEALFNQNVSEYYNLYNVGFVIAPDGIEFPNFVKKIATFGKYVVYEVPTDGIFTIGKEGASYQTSKEDFINMVHLWLDSAIVGKVFPTLILDKKDSSKANYKITDLNNILDKQSGTNINIWQENPFSINRHQSITEKPTATIKNSRVSSNSQLMEVELDGKCPECLLISKTTYHPNWKIVQNGKETTSIMVFPGYLSTRIDDNGQNIVRITYRPSKLRMLLLLIIPLSLVLSFPIKRK